MKTDPAMRNEFYAQHSNTGTVMRIKPSDVQIVVDLETLSVRPNSCITSIGAVKFNLQDGILEEFFYQC